MDKGELKNGAIAVFYAIGSAAREAVNSCPAEAGMGKRADVAHRSSVISSLKNSFSALGSRVQNKSI